MGDFYSREITDEDLPFLMEELKAGSVAGHYTEAFQNDDYLTELSYQLQQIIKMNKSGQQSGHFLYILSCSPEEQRIGYIWFKVQKAQNGFIFLEIKAFGVAEPFRGKGIASQFLSDYLDSNAHHPLEARCFASSTQMADMLKRRGFIVDAISPLGTQILIRAPL